MIVTKPAYYDKFRCIAGACPDSCCKEWSVLVDEKSAAYYRSLPGKLGNRLRQVLTDEDGVTVMSIQDGRCPMWRQDGLCRIQAELGEDALCQVCRDFPRLRHDYGDRLEKMLELSCPEAAKLILTAAPAAPIRETLPGGEAPDYELEAMEVLLKTREQVLSLLSDSSRSIPETLTLALLYGYEAQSLLDGGESVPFDPEAALASVRELAKAPDPAGFTAFFLELEILTDNWRSRLATPLPGSWEPGHLALARYFVERYWLQAVSDYDLYSRAKFIIIACLLVHHLGGDLVDTAQLFSKEIENNTDNVEAILDGAYASPAFTDDKLLGMLNSGT